MNSSSATQRKLGIAGIWFAAFTVFYILSFFLVLTGSRARKLAWVQSIRADYKLDSSTNENGFVFERDPWMKIYRPLYSHRTIYRSSKNPHDKVALNAYGKLMFASYYWGMWPAEDWKTARSAADRWAGWTYSEWYPNRYEWKASGDSRYPVHR